MRVSIPFTFNLLKVRRKVAGALSSGYDVEVGGPAVDLMPGFFDDMKDVRVGTDCPGVLQRINPLATRTSLGCDHTCQYCGIGRGFIEPGGIVELDDWPDFPVLCDNNLFGCTIQHFDKVIDRLIPHGWADFNQGVDATLITEYHAKRIAEIGKPIVRLALDTMAKIDDWLAAVEVLRSSGIAKSNINSYALVGYDTDPGEAWERCRLIEKHVKHALPMWFHPLDALVENHVNDDQKKLGWDDYQRRKIMQWFYQHKEAVR